jgi:hypothetical protein
MLLESPYPEIDPGRGIPYEYLRGIFRGPAVDGEVLGEGGEDR